MVMTRRDIPPIDMVKSAWEPFKDNLLLTLGVPAILIYVPLILVAVPVSIISVIVLGAAALTNPKSMLAIWPVVVIGCFAFAVVYNLIRVGWTRILLKLAAGEHPPFSELTKATPWFWNFLIVNFLIGAATFVGSLFFVLPGIFIAVRTCMAPYLVVDRNMGPVEAIKESNNLVTGYSWQILGYYVMFTVANLVAGFVPIVHIVLPVAVMGFFDLALTKIYLMRAPSAAGVVVPGELTG
ncbi:MAG TPA: hypothetical protein V6D22_18025 [Candidatus Obscuribacterales bacterium]